MATCDGVRPMKQGDVVQLKSGGPKMTVDFTYKFGVACTWFDGQTKREGTFEPAMLKKVEE